MNNGDRHMVDTTDYRVAYWMGGSVYGRWVLTPRQPSLYEAMLLSREVERQGRPACVATPDTVLPSFPDWWNFSELRAIAG